MSSFLAMVGLLVGGAVGWYLHGRFSRSISDPTAVQQQIDHVCEIDECVSSAMAILHDYEKRLLLGAHLSENGSAVTKTSSTDTGAEEDFELGLGRSPLREPLNGKTLLDIKRKVDRHIRECTSVLTRSTAVLKEDTIRRARELIDALITVREALEEQEVDDETSPDAIRPHVTALHESRTHFLNTARARLGLDSLSGETRDHIADLTEQTFSPAQCPRPYVTAGIRLPQQRF